jgi:hypothetical protein
MKYMKIAMVLAVLAITGIQAQAVDTYKQRFVGTNTYVNATGRDIVIPAMYFTASTAAGVTNVITATMTVTQDEPLTTNVADTVAVTYAVGSTTVSTTTAWDCTDFVLPTGATLTLTSDSNARTNSVMIIRDER